MLRIRKVLRSKHEGDEGGLTSLFSFYCKNRVAVLIFICQRDFFGTLKIHEKEREKMLKLENVERVAFLGPIGTNGWEVALELFSNKVIEKRGLPCKSNQDIIEAVSRRDASHGVVPIHNEVAGYVLEPIYALMDYRKKANKVHAIRSIEVMITHHFIGVKGTKLSDVKQVHSHPQALRQCKDHIRNLLPEGCELIETNSTAGAIEKVVALGRHDVLAIGSVRAAHMLGGKIIEEHVNDQVGNFTRFLVLSETPEFTPTTEEETRTIIAFGCKNQPGSLVDVLSVLKVFDLNAAFLITRPVGNGKMQFYLEIEGNASVSLVDNALKLMKNKCTWLNVIGSCPHVN